MNQALTSRRVAPRATALLACAALCLTHAAHADRPEYAVFDSAAVPTDGHLKVARVVPEGDAVPSSGRQLVVTFDRPVVPIGLVAVGGEQSPISISPAVSCHWHWIDPRSLACELDAAQALAPATRYTVTVAHGLTAQDGATLGADYRWTFATERPRMTGY
jgi:hypothetical protein